MKKKIIFLAAAIMLLPLVAGYCQVEEPDIVWSQYVGQEISNAIFSPDGNMILHKAGKELHLRATHTGKVIDTIRDFNGGGAINFAFFPDSKRIAVASGVKGAVIYIYDIDLGIVDSIRHYTGHHNDTLYGAALEVAISPDSRYIVYSVFVWDALEKNSLSKVYIMDFNTREVIDSIGVIGHLYFSNDGRYLVKRINVSDPDDKIMIYTVPDFKLLWEYSQGSINDAAISPDSRMVAIGGGDGYVRIWDIETKEKIFEELKGLKGYRVSTVDFSRDSKYICANWGGIGAIKIWEIKTQKVEKIYENYSFWDGDPISPDNDRIIVAKYPNMLLFRETWDFTSINEGEAIEETILYPNPTDSKVNIEFNLSEFSHVSINILDIEGKVLENLYNGKLNPGKHSFYWDCSEYLSGTYYCRIEAHNYLKTFKIIVNK